MNEVDAWLTRYHVYSVVIGGDFNVNMDFSDSFSSRIHDFVNRYRLLRCDVSDKKNLKDCKDWKTTQLQLRWDQADIASFYSYSGDLLRPVLNSLHDLLSQVDIGFVENVPDCLDRLYYDIVNILVTCAKNFVLVHRKCFYKFW